MSLTLPAFGQGQAPTLGTGRMPMTQADSVWLAHLYEIGVERVGDSLRVSPEARRTFTDSTLRRELYPATYTWQQALILMNRMELKKAFWHLMNLYATETDTERRKLALQTILAYEKLFQTDRLLVAAFYTYTFGDPTVCTIKQNRPVITRPDRLEARLGTLRELVAWVEQYRKENPVTPAR
jgi:hypothetical protein